MARIRTIKPEFFTSDDTCRLSPYARLMFIGCWLEADREGRLEWKPKTLRRKYLPEDTCDGDAIGQELVEQGVIVLYGQGLAYIPSFLKHQLINKHEAKSKLPDPHAPTEMHVHPDASPKMVVGKGKEGKGTEEPNGSLPAKAERATRKSAIDPDWKPSAELIEYARAQGCVDPADTFERFRLHHASKGTVHKDWTLAAQYWCRNESRFNPKGPARNAEPAPTVDRNSDSQWQSRINGYKPGGFWMPNDWGPRPEEAGCRVPAAILAKWRESTGASEAKVAA